MSIQAWTFALVGATFALYVFLAFLAKAKSTQDFYVAGGHVSPLANGMATAADWMSAASFISMAGLISFMGYDGSVYLMGWTGGYVLLALLLAPYLRKYGKPSPFRTSSETGTTHSWRGHRGRRCVRSSCPSPTSRGRCAAWGSCSAFRFLEVATIDDRRADRHG